MTGPKDDYLRPQRMPVPTYWALFKAYRRGESVMWEMVHDVLPPERDTAWKKAELLTKTIPPPHPPLDDKERKSKAAAIVNLGPDEFPPSAIHDIRTWLYSRRHTRTLIR